MNSRNHSAVKRVGGEEGTDDGWLVGRSKERTQRRQRPEASRVYSLLRHSRYESAETINLGPVLLPDHVSVVLDVHSFDLDCPISPQKQRDGLSSRFHLLLLDDGQVVKVPVLHPGENDISRTINGTETYNTPFCSSLRALQIEHHLEYSHVL